MSEATRNERRSKPQAVDWPAVTPHPQTVQMSFRVRDEF